MDIWKPLLLDAEALSSNNRGSHGYTALARMRPGVTLAQAQADLAGVTATFKAEYPGNYRTGFTATLRPLQEEIVGDTARPLFILLGAVGLVLLIACANVSNLLLARAASRRKEIALRTALGASRGRLVRQLMTESVLIALAGGVLGLVVASWSMDLLIGLAPDTIPRLREVTLDRRVVAFTALVSLATGVLFGIVPALRASGAALNEVLKDGGRSGESAMHGRAGRLLVVSEVALSLVLLIGAGLLVHSFARVQNVEPGFDARGMLTLRLALPESRYTTFEQGDRFFDALFAALRARPGVEAVAAANALPFSGVGGSRTFHIEGREPKRPEDQPEEQLRIVTDGYFQTMRIPVVKGREFTDRDRLSAPRVAVVNEALARKHWPGETPVGRRVAFSRDEPHWYEIVGVVANIKHRGLDAADRPELYVPYRQPLFSNWTVRPMQVVVRTAGDPLIAASTVRQDVARIDARAADLRRPHDGRSHRPVACRTAVQHGPAGGVRVAGVDAGRHRDLRNRRVRRDRADARDRRQAGARRPAARRDGDDRRAGDGDGRRRRCSWRRLGAAADAVDDEPAVRRQRRRPDHVRRHPAAARSGRVRRLLPARAPRHPSRSASGASDGVISSRRLFQPRRTQRPQSFCLSCF